MPSVHPFPSRAFRPRGALALLALGLAMILACCGDNSPTDTGAEGQHVLVYLEGDSIRVRLADLPSFVVDGQTAVQLDGLVSTTMVPIYEDKDGNLHDARVLHSYRIVGDDGFSASHKDYPDNIWEHMRIGYMLTTTRNVIFPKTAIDLPGAYNVKAARRVYVERKIDVVAADTMAFYKLADMPIVRVENLDGQVENAVALSGFVALLVGNPAAHSYHITAIDGYGTTTAMSWAQLQTGYWLLESERTIFTDSALQSGRYRLRLLETIGVE
jgi:hypothetical protein